MSNGGMSVDMYNFIENNLHKINYNIDEGIIFTPKGTNGTVCSSTGYLRVKINKKTLQVHQILSVIYFGKKCIGMQNNHINGNKLDNKKENLELLTREQNIKHAWSTGLHENGLKSKSGCNNLFSKLSKDDVIYIRDSNETNVKLAKMFNVCEKTISSARRYKSYKEVC